MPKPNRTEAFVSQRTGAFRPLPCLSRQPQICRAQKGEKYRFSLGDKLRLETFDPERENVEFTGFIKVEKSRIGFYLSTFSH